MNLLLISDIQLWYMTYKVDSSINVAVALGCASECCFSQLHIIATEHWYQCNTALSVTCHIPTTQVHVGELDI